MLENQLLISMPRLGELIDEKIVIYICEHNEKGAVGLIINCPTEYRLNFIFEQLNIASNDEDIGNQHILFGGPVQQDRGFVLHRPIKGFKENLGVDDNICISTSKEILTKIAKGKGPHDALVTLGYAGWAANQLEEEISQNLWLTCEVDEKILYDLPYEQRWQFAIDSLGLDVSKLILSNRTALSDYH